MIVAFYKVFQGREFFQASLASIYKHVDKIVIVSSSINWFGKTGNDCEQEAVEFMRKYDIDKKVILLKGAWNSQDEQQNYGWEYIRKNLCNTVDDLVMIIDSDEVWTKENLDKAFKVIEDNPDYRCYACHSIVHFKYANWRITNLDPAYLLTFVRASVEKFIGARGAALFKVGLWRNCEEFVFNHLNAVRLDKSTVFDKFKTSLEGDKVDGTNFEVWRAKWDDPLNSKELHVTKGCERNWQACRAMEDSEIPDIIKNSKYYNDCLSPLGDVKIDKPYKAKIKALLFDMDGVLYDTPRMHTKALNMALADMGKLGITDKEHLSYVGSSTHEKLEMLVKRGEVDKGEVEKICEKKKEIFEILFKHEEWKDQTLEYLQQFKMMGYNVYVISNNPKDYVEKVLTKLKSLHFVDGIVTRDDVKKGKPAPDVYRFAIGKFLLSEYECLAIEDSWEGIESASNAGLEVFKIDDSNRLRISALSDYLARRKK